MKEIKAIALAGTPYGHIPGHQYHDVEVTISRRESGLWKVVILETSGSAQGWDQEYRRSRVAGFGKELDAVIEEARGRADRAGIVERAGEYLEIALSQAQEDALEEEDSQ